MARRAPGKFPSGVPGDRGQRGETQVRLPDGRPYLTLRHTASLCTAETLRNTASLGAAEREQRLSRS
jgi:hypothetical protein